MNKNLIRGITILASCFILNVGISQSVHKHLRKGDVYYKEQQFNLAEESYRKALEKNNTLKGNFNLGNSLYNQQRYEEAEQQFMDAAKRAKSSGEKADAFYNLGNSYLSGQKYAESIEAYKSALIHNPEDVEAKQNLFVAKQLLQMQQQQQQQQQDQDQNQQEQQQQQDPNQNQQQQEQQQQQQSQSEENNEEPQPSEEEKQDLDKKDAARLLEIVENEEKKVQEKMRRVSSKKPKSKKDW